MASRGRWSLHAAALALCLGQRAASTAQGVAGMNGSSAAVASHVQRWSHMQWRCRAGSHCEIPAGEHWLLDASMDVRTLTVYGTLQWDISKDGLELRVGYLKLKGSGYLEVGTRMRPMLHRATIYFKEEVNATDLEQGSRFLWASDSSSVEIHGRKLDRTWTLLARSAKAGDTTIYLKHSPHHMGWRVGDTIGIATTTRGETRPYKIAAFTHPHGVQVVPPLVSDYLGGMRHIEVEGHTGKFSGDFEMASEVVNLDRNVVLTGPPNWDTESRLGLHTGIHSTGFMDIRYARVENCGQPPIKGRYCLHLHVMHKCPKCVLQGISVVNSTQVGITIHGTHQSLVDNNVLWNTASVGIYVEDGNEMNNTISDNAIICMHRVPYEAIHPGHTGENCQWDLFGDAGRIGGIFVIGMTNNFINNHIVNMENGIWLKGSQNPRGQGFALNRMCTMHAPFGEIRGNVCHDNRRFGMYPDIQLPRKLKRDDDGFLPRNPYGQTDWSSCDEVTEDGHDNGVFPANAIVDSFDYHNLFVGQYSMSDVEYRRYTGINNRHNMYWKSSKNFVDGSAYHIRDSLCITDQSDPVFKKRWEVYPYGHFLGPAGGFTFRMKNVTFVGDPGNAGALSAGQHCEAGGSGGPCNVQYLLEDIDFSGVAKDRRLINFGVHAHPPAEVLPVFLSKDASLGGHQAIVSKHLDGFEKEGCVKLGKEWDWGFGCSFAVRRFNVWSEDLGSLRLVGPGYHTAPNFEKPVDGQNAGYLHYAKGYNGYGALVIVGKTYRLETNFTPNIHVDMSDQHLPAFFGRQDESIQLTTRLGECTVRASEAHGLFYGRFGPQRRASQGECTAALGGIACHTAVEGDECYPHVAWALQWGISIYPWRFPGLTTDSTFEEVQQFLWETNHGNCPKPCLSTSAAEQARITAKAKDAARLTEEATVAAAAKSLRGSPR